MGIKPRKTPFSQVFIDNMSCFPPEQLEKIISMEPKGTTGAYRESKFVKLLETGDFGLSVHTSK